MKVQFMLTCLCDAFFGEVGIAAVKVLRAAGCDVMFPEGQTCCGQPPFNAGDWKASRKIADHCQAIFQPEMPIITASGSCAAMMREGYPLLYGSNQSSDDHMPGHIKCFEIGEFLVKELGISDWGAVRSERLEVKGQRLEFRGEGLGVKGQGEKPMRVAFHRACHGRGLGLKDEQERLVASLPNIELMPLGQSEQCCGFGGAFAATHGKLSSGIGLEKLRNVVESRAEILVSGDMGCLMHLNGLIQREGLPIKVMHYVQLLAEGLPE